MFELKNLSKSFADHLVFENINLKIKKGEIIAIIGPSGSGKSTLLRCLNFLEIPSSGKILFKGKEITEKNVTQIRKKVSMVFQNFNLFPHMTVGENITYPQITALKKKQKTALEKTLELLDKFELTNKIDAFPNSLSGGQKQRVAIMRSLALNPEVLLLDEPTSALDYEMKAEVINSLESLVNSGITLIMVTHEMAFLKKIATKIIFFDHGQIIEEAKPEVFFKSPSTQRAKDFIKKIYNLD